MKSYRPPFLMILVLISFLVPYECNIISRRDIDEKAEQRELSSFVDLSKQKHFEGDILLPAGNKRPIGGIKPSAVYENGIWPGAKIPYVISNEYNQAETNLILDAMKSFNMRTCLQFLPRTTEMDYIDISKAGSGCSSFVGRLGGRQMLSLDNNCLRSSIVKHELMHAVGFNHEQSRTDRDDYVTIHFDNIQTGKENNFEKYDSKAVQLLGTPYDLKSIMHYIWNAFAKDDTKPTITAKDGSKIEPSTDFTSIDIRDIKRLYKCTTDFYENEINWKEQTWKNGKFFWASDCDIVGKTILQVKSKNGDCGGLCAANLQCTHFTWKSKGGICSLKIAPKFSTEIRLAKGVMCGYITEGNSDFKWQDDNKGLEKVSHNCDFPDNDIHTELVFTKESSCFSLCLSEPKCTHYSVENLESSTDIILCTLKKGKSPIAVISVKASCGMISARI